MPCKVRPDDSPLGRNNIPAVTGFGRVMRAVRIDAIQIARMFAALLVVLDHALINLMSAGMLEVNHPFAFRSGGFGVLVFFLISGFVMSHSMYDNFAKDGVWKNFLVRRLVRITPLYWLVLLLIAAKMYATSTLDSPGPLVMSMAYVPYMATNGEVQPLNGVGWTLNYEMEFYLIFALCLCFSRRIGAVLLSSVLIGLVMFRDALVSPLASSEFWSTAVAFWCEPIILYFLGGVWLGMLRAWLDRRQGAPEMGMGVLLGGLVVMLAAYEILLYQDLMPRWLEALLAFAIVAALGLTTSEAKSAPTRFLKLLGDASYSTYLTHMMFLSVLWKIIGTTTFPPVVSIVIAMVGANIAGLAIYKLIEKPMLVKMQSWISRPARIAVAAEKPAA
jgi:exopolysaccharide production protein ExoZ